MLDDGRLLQPGAVFDFDRVARIELRGVVLRERRRREEAKAKEDEAENGYARRHELSPP